jgi:hypothetical protein
MARRKDATPAQIINALRKAEVELANGKSVREVCNTLAVSEHTYYRWRREYGGMNTAQAKKLKALEKENRRVERIWSQEGLKVPRKQRKRGRIWLNDGSCIRLRPLYKHHVWS